MPSSPLQQVVREAVVGYAGLIRRVLRVSALMLVLYGGLIGLTVLGFSRAPSGFIPRSIALLHRGHFAAAGASLERPTAWCARLRTS